MAKHTGGPLVPGDDFLKRVLSAEPDKIADRLKEVHQKLESRFTPALRNLVATEEQALAKIWDTFKAQVDLQDLFNTRVVFKNAGDTRAFEKLVQFSDRLILLDPELKEGLRYIVNHKGIDAAFPQNPNWLKVGRSLLELEASANGKINLYLDSREVQALVLDYERGKEAASKHQSAVQPNRKDRPASRFKTEPRPQTGGIEDVGFVWKYRDARWPKYHVDKGWEPRLEGSRYKSIFRTPIRGLSEAVSLIKENIEKDKRKLKTPQNDLEVEALEIEIERNKSKVARLNRLIDVFDSPRQRKELLEQWKKEFPPPKRQ
jgi:hypothetical protein